MNSLINNLMDEEQNILLCDEKENESLINNNNNGNINDNNNCILIAPLMSITSVVSNTSQKLLHSPHFDFIIGRGKILPKGNMNLPMNPIFAKRNIIYIDSNPNVEADIRKPLHLIDFSSFGITKQQDPNEHISVKFYFDWSSFYCGALQNLTDTIMALGRQCQILVPLDAYSDSLPDIIKPYLESSIFTLTIVEGQFPLFDWSAHESQNISTICSLLNSQKYICIYAFGK